MVARVRPMCSSCGKRQAMVKDLCRPCAKEKGVQPTALVAERRCVKIDAIDTERSHQVRQSTYRDTVDAYAEAMKDGDEFPPIVLFEDVNGILWLADGWHRVEAAVMLARQEIEADVYRGNADDAVDYAFKANAAHNPRPMSNADKRHAVCLALSLPRYTEESDRGLAKLVGVSHEFVRLLRQEKLSTVDTAHQTAPAEPPPAASVPDVPPDVAAPVPDDRGDAWEPEPGEIDDRTVDRTEADAEPDYEGGPEPDHTVNGNGTAPKPRATKKPAVTSSVADVIDPPPLDAVGVPVPPFTRAAFASEAKFAECRSRLRAAADALADLAVSPGGEEMASDMQMTKSGDRERFESDHIQRLLGQLKLNAPYAGMCPYCTYERKDLPPSHECKGCHGRGWVKKRAWDQSQREHRAAVLAHKPVAAAPEGGAECA